MSVNLSGKVSFRCFRTIHTIWFGVRHRILVTVPRGPATLHEQTEGIYLSYIENMYHQTNCLQPCFHIKSILLKYGRGPLKRNLLSRWSTVQGSRQLWYHTHREPESWNCSRALKVEAQWRICSADKRVELPSEIKTCAKMDMLNKLKDNFTSYASSAVTNTVYNTGNIISGVLPGNPVTR